MLWCVSLEVIFVGKEILVVAYHKEKIYYACFCVVSVHVVCVCVCLSVCLSVFVGVLGAVFLFMHACICVYDLPIYLFVCVFTWYL